LLYNDVIVRLNDMKKKKEVLKMPPKAKLSKEEIIETAFEMTRENGFEHVTARELAHRLGCSTQPIFHVFQNMEEVKKEVYERTRDFITKEMMENPHGEPLFLYMGLRYVELAGQEKNLFRLLCMSDSFRMNSIYELAGAVPEQADARLFVKVWVFTHGIASVAATNTTSLPREEIRELLTEVYKEFAHEG